MKLSRYIKFPLIFGLLMASSRIVPYFLFDNSITLNEMLGWFIYGVLFGFGVQIYSDYKTRKVKSNATEKDFEVRQKKDTFLLYDYDEAFDLCLKSVELLRKGKVKAIDKKLGFIRARSGFSWKSWGSVIELRLQPITENLTEIEIFTRPIPRTSLIDNGEGLEIIKTLTDFFDSKNKEVNRNLVEAKFDVPIDAYVNRSQKVKI